MKTFTGFEYIMIDVANAFGLDKLVFEQRIQWVREHLTELESLAVDAEDPYLYVKAVQALRKAQQGIPTGHLVALDAVCSGAQLMSVLTGCINGARATGLVNPDERSDAYTQLTDEMNRILASQGLTVSVPRKDAKKALMTTLYGSKATPKSIFGEDTPELDAFYQALQNIVPGAWQLLQALLASWQPMALSHDWVLPDNFHAKIKVMQKIETRIEVDELNHATFTYEYADNIGADWGLSNAANAIHSIDAYVLRSMHRRCNYNQAKVQWVRDILETELEARQSTGADALEITDPNLEVYLNHWKRTGIVDVVILPVIKYKNVAQLPTEYIVKLQSILDGMLAYKPFDVITIHDSFACHPNNCNHLRQQYINILMDLADSDLMQDILSQIMGKEVKLNKLSNNLKDYIKESNYGIC